MDKQLVVAGVEGDDAVVDDVALRIFSGAPRALKNKIGQLTRSRIARATSNPSACGIITFKMMRLGLFASCSNTCVPS